MAWEIRWASAAEDPANPVEAAEEALRQINEHGCQSFEVRRVGEKNWVKVDLEVETMDDLPYNDHEGGCSGDCNRMPDGRLACATPIQEV